MFKRANLRRNFSERLRRALNLLVEHGELTPEGAEFLSQMLSSSEAVREEQDEFLVSIDRAYLANEINYEENYEARRKSGCAELSVHPRKYSAAANCLVRAGILIEKKDGIAPTEPSHQVPLEILLNRTALEPMPKYARKLTRLISQLVSLTGILVPLTSRQTLVNEITSKLNESPSILLSKSPSIFNPSEFEATYSNHTSYFANVVGTVNQPLYYFWDLDAVCSQIKGHLKEWSGNIKSLIERYERHFAPFAKNEHLTVICGNNSIAQQNWEVHPFVSAQFLVKGERVEGKLKGGAMVNRERLAKFAAASPYLGKLATLVIETYFDERYERLKRKMVEDPDNIVLQQHDEASIKDFVAGVFRTAIRDI